MHAAKQLVELTRVVLQIWAKLKLPQALGLIREGLGAQRLKCATHKDGHVIAVLYEIGKFYIS